MSINSRDGDICRSGPTCVAVSVCITKLVFTVFSPSNAMIALNGCGSQLDVEFQKVPKILLGRHCRKRVTVFPRW